MQMKRLAALLILLAPAIAYARIGETREQVESRLGKCKQVYTVPVARKVEIKKLFWNTKSLYIEAEVLDGKVISESYTTAFGEPWTARAIAECMVKNTPHDRAPAQWREESPGKWAALMRARCELAGTTLKFTTWNYNALLHREDSEAERGALEI